MLNQMKKIFLVIVSLWVAMFAYGRNLQDVDVAILGDSMTWIGGDSCQNDTGWTYYFKRETSPLSVSIYARSGATWTNTKRTTVSPDFYSEVLDDNNVLYNQAARLVRDTSEGRTPFPGLIILYAGANDAWFEKSRPGMFIPVEADSIRPELLPSQATSLDGSIMLTAGYLHQHFPDARIVFVTPVEMSKTSPDKVYRVADTISRTASRLGYEVIRADRNVEIRHLQECRQFKHTYDGVHTNPSGARLIAKEIIRML